MTFLDLLILSLVTYRVTRFLQLDSMLDELRKKFGSWLRRGATYRDEGGKVWPFKFWRRKWAQLLECPFCESVWVAIFGLLFWWQIDRYDMSWAYPVDVLAIAAGGMVVYKWIDPPHPPQPCVPTKPCE